MLERRRVERSIFRQRAPGVGKTGVRTFGRDRPGSCRARISVCFGDSAERIRRARRMSVPDRRMIILTGTSLRWRESHCRAVAGRWNAAATIGLGQDDYGPTQAGYYRTRRFGTPGVPDAHTCTRPSHSPRELRLRRLVACRHRRRSSTASKVSCMNPHAARRSRPNWAPRRPIEDSTRGTVQYFGPGFVGAGTH